MDYKREPEPSHFILLRDQASAIKPAWKLSFYLQHQAETLKNSVYAAPLTPFGLNVEKLARPFLEAVFPKYPIIGRSRSRPLYEAEWGLIQYKFGDECQFKQMNMQMKLNYSIGKIPKGYIDLPQRLNENTIEFQYKWPIEWESSECWRWPSIR